jgi:hypothetical protein
MSNEARTFSQKDIRGTDSNSLLRRYDQANEIFTKSSLQLERVRAGKVVERISKELRRRKVPL